MVFEASQSISFLVLIKTDSDRFSFLAWLTFEPTSKENREKNDINFLKNQLSESHHSVTEIIDLNCSYSQLSCSSKTVTFETGSKCSSNNVRCFIECYILVHELSGIDRVGSFGA